MADNEATPSPSGSNSNLEYYQCSQCGRSYSRVDHLARHVRSHLQQKPFECSICNKGFGRPDVLKRHALSHEPDANDPKRQKRHFGQSSRVAQACKACASAKLKCEDEKPCRRCRHKNISCEYGTEQRFPSQFPSENNQQIVPPQPQQHAHGTMQHDYTQLHNPTSSSQVPTPEADNQATHETIPRSNTGPDQNTILDANVTDGDFTDFLRDVVMPPQMDPSSSATSAMTWPQHHDYWPRDVLNFTIDSNLDLEPVDLGMLDALSGLKPGPYPDLTADMEDAEASRNFAAIGTKAFENSPVARWKPTSKDNMYVGQPNLALPDGPHTRLRVDQSLLAYRMDLRSRDALLALVLANCEPVHVARIVATFPTIGLLDDLVQRFFLQQRPRIGSWVHASTFRPSHDQPHLLAAIVAAGAIMTGTKSLRKFGFALHEALRLAIPKACEANNSITRELWVLQSLMFDLDIGIWSGDQRRMELSESSQQILVTMLRRGGRFQRTKSPPVVPLPQDTGEVLYNKWLQWVEQESLKRLVFHAYLHTAQSSMALLVNPIISYAELSLQLPEPADLWTAETAEKWKSIYLSKPPRPPELNLSALDAIREPTSLVALQQFCDLQHSASIILHAIACMVWEYTQMAAITRNKPEHSNPSLIMKSRHQEICQTLIQFRMSMSEWMVEPSAEVLLIFDLLLMYLHMSLEEIQLFAGREGKDEARRVYPLLQQWIGSSNSREAMWHAAQVLRRARSFVPHTLRDFYAIAVYHASIAFWTYGLISKVKPVTDPEAMSGAGLAAANPYVLLDGDGMADIQRFIALGRGIPSISGRSAADSPQLTCVPLNDPEVVMDSALNTLKQNYPGRMEDALFPPMVENLMQLMRDLGRAARGLKR